MEKENSTKIFYPEFKLIAKFFLILPVIICSLTIIAIIVNLINKPINWYQIVVFIPLCLIIISSFLNLFFIYDTMRYEFRYDGLYLICGKYINKISYDKIVKWKKKNLKFHPLGSIRMPGFSLGYCYFSFVGTVIMYATSSGKNVLLIYTKGPTYGITPKNEKEFIEELEKRINLIKFC